MQLSRLTFVCFFNRQNRRDGIMSSENGNKRGKNCEKNVEKRRSNHSSSRLSVTFLWKILLQQVPPFTTTAVHQLSCD